MPDGFVALAALLRGDETPDANSEADVVPNERDAEPQSDLERSDVLHELGRMRLAAREALDRAVARTLEALATDVLARELALAPADVDALVARALVVYADHEPIEIVVAAADAANVAARADVAMRADAALRAGDLVVRVRDGSFESPIAFRLARVLATATGA